MKKLLAILGSGGLALIAVSAFAFSSWTTGAAVAQSDYRTMPQRGFQVDILVEGRPVQEYVSRGRTYVEAIAGAEYEVRVYNPLPYRVAVALSVDGLNTIDARHTSAWNASKWVIEPYGTINISGWQMSSQRARRFYFTTERDSYGAKLGQTSNLGLVTAVFFRERRTYPVPITPAPYPGRSSSKDDRRERDRSEVPSSGTADSTAENKARSGGDVGGVLSSKRAPVAQPVPDDEYAATGIGRSVHNDVRWVNMELDSRPAGEVTIRYEYYPALVRLGILPRRYEYPDPMRRRENARGFEDRRFSPEP